MHHTASMLFNRRQAMPFGSNELGQGGGGQGREFNTNMLYLGL